MAVCSPLDEQNQSECIYLLVMKHLLSMFFLCLTLGAWAQATPDTVCTLNCTHPGYRSLTQEVGGETIMREYILHVPAGYDEALSYPLVIVYHGFGGCASYWADEVGDDFGFNALADEEGFLVAYPQAAYRPAKESTYWEPGNGTGDHIYDNDVYFTEQLIAHVASDHNVSSEEVYAAGYSNGGMMAYSVGCTRGDMVAAIGVMSGAMLDDAGSCDTSNPVPVIIFHGVGDYVLPYNGNEWYASVADVVDLWLDHNGIPAASQVTTQINGGNVVHDAYSGGNDGTCLSFYTVEEEYGAPGDHVWFSEPMDGDSPGRVLWDFFNSGCAAVSSTEDQSAEVVGVHPVPFGDRIFIQGLASGDMEYRLTTLSGQIVRNGVLSDDRSVEGLATLPFGVYVLHIEGQRFRIVK